MKSISPVNLNIVKKLKEDKAFREDFFRGQAQDEIAMSLRSLREKRTMRQIDLAKKTKMKQSAISRIEQADYSGWTFNTLFRIAEALDARLRIIFEPIEIVFSLYAENKATLSTQSEQNLKDYFVDTTDPKIKRRQVQTLFISNVFHGHISTSTYGGLTQ